ncbi:MAG: hypothetical protein LC689_07890 [Myxococcales bacterium]|nr:hypothetical protein [Myxococcales bacterium]
MSEPSAWFAPVAEPLRAAGDTCEVCGEAGRARVCACDGADLVCHLADCETVCVKCNLRAKALRASQAEKKPESRDPVEPCILKVQEGCQVRKLDAAAALGAYRALGIDRHSKNSFAADVLFGHFENVRLEGEAKLGENDLDDFRHKSRCWTCWPPQPRLSSQWCIHPREFWDLLEKQPTALTREQLVAQIEAIGRKKAALLEATPATARELIARRLVDLFEFAEDLRKPRNGAAAAHGGITAAPVAAVAAVEASASDAKVQTEIELRDAEGALIESVEFEMSLNGTKQAGKTGVVFAAPGGGPAALKFEKYDAGIFVFGTVGRAGPPAKTPIARAPVGAQQAAPPDVELRDAEGEPLKDSIVYDRSMIAWGK